MLLERGLKLKKEIKKLDHAYYVLNQSLVSDAEYDRMYKEYEELEKMYPELKTIDSPTQRVGSEPVSALEKITHPTPLLSIDQKSKSTEDLIKWYRDCGGNGTEVLITPKYDGITVDTNYNNGLFTYAATRGNGYIGEVISENIKTIKSTPLSIEFGGRLEVRGEGVIHYEDFVKKFSKEYSNPRNLASGTLRQLDSKACLEKKPDIVYYDIGICDKNFEKDSERLSFLKDLGFKVTPYILVNNEEDLVRKCENYMDGFIRDKGGFNVLDNTSLSATDIVCDGLVLKVNDLKLRDKLGFTSKGPKFFFAYKFKSLQAETKLIKVEYQVGKTGRITPVGIFEPITLGGVTISRATLNNIDYIRGLDLHLNSNIIVERSNDVIPKVIGKGNVSSDEAVINIPTTCPCCGHSTVQVGPLLFCSNINCVDRLKGLIKHFVSRDAMNIVGLGDAIIDLFVDKGYLSSIVDLYSLKNHYDDLIKLDGFGKRKVDKLIKSIEESKKVESWRVLYALSIDGVGRTMSKSLLNKFNSIDAIINASLETLLEIEDMGEITSNTIKTFFNNQENIKILNELKEIGLKFEEEKKEISSNKLEGKTFVITGTLKENRKYYESLVEANGGKCSSSVSKKTFAVIIGEDAGSKADKAYALNDKGAEIKIFNGHDEFIKFLNN